MEKILITGASGFVGSFLVEACLNQFPNVEVWAGVRTTSSRKYLQDKRINFFEMDFSKVEDLEKKLGEKSFDYVIHNAGLTKADKKDDFYKVNYDNTKNLIYALQKVATPPKKFVFISSMASYGPADNMPGGEVLESHTPHPIDTYGRSKLKAEKFIQETSQLPYLIFRPTAVYGPRETDIYTFFTLIKKGFEPYIGRKEQQLTFIYVKDLARLVVQACFSEIINKAYFLTDMNIYSNYDLGKYAKELLNKKTLKVKVPTTIVRGIASINEVYGKISGRMPPLNLEKVKILESLNWKCDIRSLKIDFDFVPQYDLKSGLKETIDWYKKEKWL